MDINRAKHCWESMQKALLEQLGDGKYFWFKNLTVYSAEKNLLILTHPDQFTAQHVQRVYGQTLLLYAAALAVAENPGKEYNPLFIYGGAGLGKTHLITAIANYIQQNSPDTVIEFSNSEKFTNEVVEAIRERKTNEFKARMRRVDVLFVDDV